MKKSQISIFLIVVVVLLAFGVLFFYFKSFTTKDSANRMISQGSSSSNANGIKTYGESCLQSAGEKYLFLLGSQGGYIEPLGGLLESGVPIGSSAIDFQGKKIPIYLDGSDKYYPDINYIKFNIMGYIPLNLQECFSNAPFDDMGIIFEKMDEPVLNAFVNNEHVKVTLNYPLKVYEGNKETLIEAISSTFPIRLESIYLSAIDLTDKAEVVQPYDISGDCNTYNKNGMTSIFIKPTSDPSIKIIQFVDSSTLGSHYQAPYIFQFAVKNVDISGECV